MPYPPNYGGVIDVFYKIKALAELGVKIYLHTFEYGRGTPKELENYCEEIFYYPRNRFVKSIISKTPFIVKSRANNQLIKNVKTNKAPILFEGLHTTYPLLNATFNDRLICIRAHNIEHLYYDGLSKSEQRLDKKLFFKSEARKLAAYEKIMAKADHIFTISPFEQAYFQQKFGKKARYIPVFHQHATSKILPPKGKFALYHGDLRVADNIKSALFLIDAFSAIKYPLIIASGFVNNGIVNKIKEHTQISYKRISNQQVMAQLLEEAHIHVLPTFQKTGIKLKLINALFNGRHLVVTPEMVEDTGLEDLCEKAKGKDEFKQKVLGLLDTNLTMQSMKARKEKLKAFDVIENARKIVELL